MNVYVMDNKGMLKRHVQKAAGPGFKVGRWRDGVCLRFGRHLVLIVRSGGRRHDDVDLLVDEPST